MPTRDLCAGVAGALRIAAGQFDDFVESPGSVVLSIESECPLTGGSTPFGVLSELRRLFALAGEAMAVARPEWLPPELRGCCGDGGPASTFLAKAIVSTSWLSPGEIDVYDVGCGAARACRMAVDSIEAWGDAWGMDEPVAETTSVQIDPPDAVSGEAAACPSAEVVAERLQALVKAVQHEARQNAAHDRRSEDDAEMAARDAGNEIRHGTPASNLYELLRLGMLDATGVVRDTLRKTVRRARERLGWLSAMPDNATRASKDVAADLAAGAGLSREAPLVRDVSRVRWCPVCKILPVPTDGTACRCSQDADIRAAHEYLDDAGIKLARESAAEELADAVRESLRKPPRPM